MPHPEFLPAPQGYERTVVVATPDGLYEVIDLLLVASIGTHRTAGVNPAARSRDAHELGDGQAISRRRRRT